MKAGITLYFCFLVAISTISCSGDENTIKVKGSDTEVNLAVQFAEDFHENHPGIFVSVSGGGSGLGIASLINGTADIANSSRSINTGEKELFRAKAIPLDSFVFAQDAIAIVVADKLPLDSISTIELGRLLSGEYKNWSALTGQQMPVNIYGRQSNSGTHDYVKNKLGIRFSPYAKQMNGNAQILEAIRADNSGIGYVGAGYVTHGTTRGIKILPVYSGKGSAAVSPLDAGKIAMGAYFFQRPLFQYFKKSSYKKIRPLLDFEKGIAGRLIIKNAGYYPITP